MPSLDARLKALEAQQAGPGGYFVHWHPGAEGEHYTANGAPVDRATFADLLGAAGPSAVLIRVEYAEDWREGA